MRPEDYSGLPTSREEARAIRARTYYDGRHCKQGHVSPRRTDEGKCVACINKRMADRRVRVPDRIKEIAKSFRERHPEHVKAEKKKYYEANKDQILAAQRHKYAIDPDLRAKYAVWREGWKRANPERKKEIDRRWVVENRDRHNENGRRWREANPEHGREYARASYQKDPKAHYEKTRKWLKNNPHKSIQYNSARRTRLLNAEGNFTAEEFADICKRQRDRCAACRKKRKLTADHIKALSAGGTNWPNNIQGLCHSCNSRKHAKDAMQFMRERGFLL